MKEGKMTSSDILAHYVGILVTLLFCLFFLPRECTINHTHPKKVIKQEEVPAENPLIEELERVMKQTGNVGE